MDDKIYVYGKVRASEGKRAETLKILQKLKSYYLKSGVDEFKILNNIDDTDTFMTFCKCSSKKEYKNMMRGDHQEWDYIEASICGYSEIIEPASFFIEMD